MKTACVLALSLATLSTSALAQSDLWRAYRVTPESLYNTNPCSGPCLCVWAGPFLPTTGRMYMTIAPSIPEQTAYNVTASLNARALDGSLQHLDGTGALLTTILPDAERRLTLTFDFPDRADVALDSGFVPVGSGETLETTIRSEVFACTSYSISVVASPICPADFDDGSQTGTPDDAVSIDDLLYYIGLFADGAAIADMDDGQGLGMTDGAVTIDDVIYFLDRFQSGC
ncbi:MAG: GC-type dockerin domain-anchored protein [Phycisphaerales bacterium]|nr:MAG: hypothetical protein IPK69_09635 [Phycisphaerales bacterium]